MSDMPSRLHHSAVVVKDLAASKTFYEDIMGLPLVATWCESNEALGDFCHAFFGLKDESAVALFQFADEQKYQQLKKPDTLSPFHHLALTGTKTVQDDIRSRADVAGIGNYTINHGYCVSLYLDDPDGHKVEITYDTQEATDNFDLIRDRAASELTRWLSGDHQTNNDLRNAAAEPQRE
ncbi:MAG: VOC family protein [Pseudomonadales bacterium]